MIGKNQCEHGSLSRSCIVCELQAENARLQGELEEVKAHHRYDLEQYRKCQEECEQLKAEVESYTVMSKEHALKLNSDIWKTKADTYRAAAEGLVKALKAQIQMRDMKKPKKLEEELSWRDNDDLANKWAIDSLAAWEKVRG